MIGLTTIAKTDVPFVDKGDGTSVWYFIFPEHEIHWNYIDPGTTQVWHHHAKINEDILLIEGELRVSWLDDAGRQHDRDVEPGTLVRVGNSVHTFANPGQCRSTFVVFRFVPQGVDNHDIIKSDKIVHAPPHDG